MNAQYNPQGTIIENLCKRYASSRVPAVRHEVSAQERSAVLDSVILSEAENVRITEREIDVYKNGNQYMDSDAYAEMFRARRAAARSEATRRAETVTASAPKAEPVYETPAAHREMPTSHEYTAQVHTPTPRVNEYTPAEQVTEYEQRTTVRKESKVESIISAVKDWVECDLKVLRLRRRAKSFPVLAFASVVMIAISLFLIVSGSVMLMESDSEIAELKSDISQIENQADLLNSRLEEKNNLTDIAKAAESLGMIRSEYVSVRFVSDNKYCSEGSVKLYNTDEKEEDTAVFGTLLSALGIGN
jgi:cell division protein FtsL